MTQVEDKDVVEWLHDKEKHIVSSGLFGKGHSPYARTIALIERLQKELGEAREAFATTVENCRAKTIEECAKVADALADGLEGFIRDAANYADILRLTALKQQCRTISEAIRNIGGDAREMCDATRKATIEECAQIADKVMEARALGNEFVEPGHAIRSMDGGGK